MNYQAKETKPPRALVAEAKKIKNLLDRLQAFKTFSKKGLHVKIHSCWSKDLTRQMAAWTLNLTRENMKDLYSSSEWGWNDHEKRQELAHRDARFLIATTTAGKLAGFVHFRFDMDYGVPVLYCYEIQLEPFAQRVGLGQYFMLTLELLAIQTHMQKVVLTVFKHNNVSKDFFTKKLRYDIDETSPENLTSSYEILSKKISKRLLNIRHEPTVRPILKLANSSELCKPKQCRSVKKMKTSATSV